MKIKITEEQFKLLKEQTVSLAPIRGYETGKPKYDDLKDFKNVWSKLFNKIKDFVTTNINKLKAVDLTIGTLNFLNDDDIKNFRKVRLIFPSKDWEKSLLTLINSRIITGIYENLNDAKKFLNHLIKKGVKAKEIVIGSHGGIGTLLITKKGEEDYSFNNSFLNSFKSIVQPDSVVFFTACYGADYLLSLKDAAEKLGVGVYGSAGIYNYVTNSSEKGFYYCSAKNYQIPKSNTLMKPYVLDCELSRLKEVVIPNIDTEKIKAIITVDPKYFYKPVLPFELDGYSVNTINMSGKGVMGKQYAKVFKFDKAIDSAMNEKNSGILNGYVDILNKKGINSSDAYNKWLKLICNGIKTGKIRIKFQVGNGKDVDLLSLQSMYMPMEVTNEFLLENKLCQKVSKSPISWF